jgi:hypothetical protein
VHVREHIIMEEPEALGAALEEAVGLLCTAEPDLDEAGLPMLLAILATGRFDLVRPLLTAEGTAAAPLQALVLGRYLAWTGDLHLAASLWPRIHGSIGGWPMPPAGDAALIARAGALQAVERMAADLGDPRTAARVHVPAREAAAALRLRLGRGDAADGDLIVLAAAAGLGDAADTPPFGPAAAGAPPAAVVLHTVHALLGADPDAARHRLRLRPVVPAAGRLRIRDIGFGDATLSLAVAAASGAVTIEIEQDAGALPATVLLEPLVAGNLTGARVDGEPAALAPRPWRGRLLVPVQLVLDARRTLVLEIAGDAKGPPM